MSLANSHTFVPGELLTAANLNGVVTNILNNPIALISPSTGAINFNLQAHTGLIPSAITATSATAGQALMSTGGAAVSFQSVLSTVTPPLAGSTGQVFAITSSNTGPSFQVLPIDGGLSTDIPTGGMIYFVGTSAAFLRGLTIGTSGQVLTVTTSGTPGWATGSGSGSGGAGSRDPNIYQFYEDFNSVITSGNLQLGTTASQSTANTYVVTNNGPWLFSGNAPFFALEKNALGVLGFVASTNETNALLNFPLTPTIETFFTTQKITFQTRYKDFSTQVGQKIVGFTTGSFSTAPTNGIFLLSTTGSATVSLWVVSTAGSTSLSAGVTASSYQMYQVTISSSSIDFVVNGASVGSITAFNPSSGLYPVIAYAGFTNAAPGSGVLMDYVSILTSGR